MRTQTLALGAGWLGALALACSPSGGSGGSKPPFRVSGTASVAANTTADGDTNDPFAPFAANDSAPSAQELPNPVIVGGHVNVVGAFPPGGSPGRTTAAGDPEDWYRVSIAAGQLLRLNLAEDGATNDLSLLLLRSDQTPVAASDGATRTEEIEVATSDDYLVVVRAEAGFSNYTLSIGQPDPGAAGAVPDFVPGQVVLRARPRAGVSPLGAAELGMRHLAGAAGAPQLFDFSEPGQRAAALRAMGLEPAAPLRRVPGAAAAAERAALREDTRRVVEALRRRPDVASADLNYWRQPSAVPSDEFYDLQWHYEQIDLPAAWDLVTPNSGVVVAVVDTGVVLAHPDLASQLVPGYDFIQSNGVANDGDGCDADPDDPGDNAPGGNSYHGTHVAGTVAAATSLQPGGLDEGVAGVAWNARVMPLRVLGVGGGTDFDILQSLLHAAGRSNACSNGASVPAQIVNMSLGGPGFSQTFQDVLLDLRDTEGLIFVAAAGNESTTAPSYPAAYDGVVSVSATGPGEGLAPYSNRGNRIDVAAPGGDFSQDLDGDGFPDGVLSTLFDDDQNDFVYAFYQGTSMAAPHVAGVFALMLGVNPDITPDDIDTWLAARPRLITDEIGPASSFGNGLIDAARAVDVASTLAGGGGLQEPVLRVDPDSLNFGLLADQFRVNASNGGDESQPLLLGAVTASTDAGGEWLGVQTAGVDADGLGDYRVQVDRSGLADGIYTGSLLFDSDANDVEVPVIVQVGDIDDLAELSAGHHYVLLVDPESLDTVAQLESDPESGVYAFRFEDVDEGVYLVIAGTDADNDAFICDAGEACGAFPTTETAEEVLVERNQKLVFVTGFSAPFSGASGDGGRKGFRLLPRGVAGR